jgi:hypothetical protein
METEKSPFTNTLPEVIHLQRKDNMVRYVAVTLQYSTIYTIVKHSVQQGATLLNMENRNFHIWDTSWVKDQNVIGDVVSF